MLQQNLQMRQKLCVEDACLLIAETPAAACYLICYKHQYQA